ncbi:AAA-like domain-containing protein [Nodosilinea sp. LEGE 06152]|uniref:AAA-like domain-containing protein n=1 Tax=Nodosilinea sp. LEGE 06152 TaxID=2777966 RepID=UPI00188035C1|nr:AAA-like domain-containing protein [Nodosilinea sp. LEGE 06152]MBE9160590.1 AAA-like domain-containing protein [Nodosilinea sp. LEGE 06152]
MVEYRVGGSLAADDPTYIEREADRTLYEALINGELCYVLTSRQMGKSSLRVRTSQRLEAEGMGRCAAIDLTRIGSQQITPEQWYLGLAFDLRRRFHLAEGGDLPTWWQGLGPLPPVQKLSHWIETVLLVTQPNQPLFIFLDEIDSVKGLSFGVGDFFGLVRFCYNQRAEHPPYRRLNWALFGVATPHDLVAEAHQTPFNIGRAISLAGFTPAEATPLAAGLVGLAERPEQVLAAVLHWTGGQPFLTQKLCGLIQIAHRDNTLVAGVEGARVEALVRSHLLHHWEVQDDPEHLRTIRDRLLADKLRSGRLLSLYQRILTVGTVPADGSPDQAELKLSGIAIAYNGHLQIANLIYAEVFNLAWVNQCLAQQRPYAVMLQAWVASKGQDDSRLLMGQALQDALQWAAHKSLSDLDYRYLSASQEWDVKMVRLELEAKNQANRMLAAAQRKANQTIWFSYLSLGACLAISLVALLISLLRP